MLYLLLVAFLGLQVADGVTTYRGLNAPSGSISEANPVARWAFQRFGLVAPIVALKAAMSALGVALALHPSLLTTGALALLTAVGGWVIWNNLKVLREAR